MPAKFPISLKIKISSVSDIEELRFAVMSSTPKLLNELAHQTGSFSYGCNVFENEMTLDFDSVVSGFDAQIIAKHALAAVFSHEGAKTDPQKMTILIEWC